MSPRCPTVLVLCLLCWLPLACCFSLFPSKKTEDPPPSSSSPSSSFFRGIPPHLRDKYDAELFSCGGEQGSLIPRARINDNYCDCEDGSDEPGTSACATGSFSCRNEGFSPLLLTSSRVDDGVCDCCDGSDEGGGVGESKVCENTCEAQAAASRQAMQQSLLAYEAGSAVREQYIRDVTEKVREGEATLASLDANVQRVEEEVARLEEILVQESALEQKEKIEIKQSLLNEYSVSLGLQSLGEGDLATLIASLFTVFDVIDEDVPELLKALQRDDPAAMRPVVEVLTEASGDNMDTYGDYDEDYDDRHEDIPEYKESDEDVDDSSPPKVYTAANCGLLKHEMDDRLGPFCELDTKDLRRFVVNFLISRKAAREAQLLLGFFALKKSFSESAEFVAEHKLDCAKNQPAAPCPCPADFSAVSGACELEENLKAILAKNNFADHKKKGAEEMRAALRDLSSKQTKYQQQRREHEDLVKASKDYVGLYEFLALRNQCFDKPDGQYTYSICFGKDAKQKDTTGGGSTLLGNFQTPASGLEKVNDPKKGLTSIRMKFERGQHCHAFGARSAEVLIKCGQENALLEASEPSTCFYSFRMESPVACNEDFARSIGLTV